MSHLSKRLEERYNIFNISSEAIIDDILNDKALLLNSTDYSHIFLVRCKNKFVKVVTDFNINYVKTAIPFLINDMKLVNQLNYKLDNIVA